MSDNAFIFGAGFSFDARIPLLDGFVERMFDYSYRKTNGTWPLRDEQLDLLQQAVAIIKSMASYHRQVYFDDRNIEDVMSVLAFDAFLGGRKAKNTLSVFTQAIAETIELSCEVTHRGVEELDFTQDFKGEAVYRAFWMNLFTKRKQGKAFPTIITLNYDLVPERSLFQAIQTLNGALGRDVGFDAIILDYSYSGIPEQKYMLFRNSSERISLVSCEAIDRDIEEHRILRINILKLHGSLNFPLKVTKDTNIVNVVKSVPNANLVPPVSNKQSGGSLSSVWSQAMTSLREAKKVTFVGYSLPITDTYMQYFLRASLGPNEDLRSIAVFDPKFNDGATPKAIAMKERYKSCFSQQMQKHIKFNPSGGLPGREDHWLGKTRGFVECLEHNAGNILY